MAWVKEKIAWRDLVFVDLPVRAISKSEGKALRITHGAPLR